MKKIILVVAVILLAVLLAPFPKSKGYYCDFPPCQSYNSLGKVILENFSLIPRTMPSVGVSSAESAVTDFYELLVAKNYAKAATLYDGLYEGLNDWNPATDPNDLASLWKNGCEHNGLTCLRAEIIKKTAKTRDEVFSPNDMLAEWRAKGQEYSNLYEFTVRYHKADGSVFEIGPCCGAEDTGQRTSEFPVLAGEKNGAYFVLTPPPYTP